MKGMHLNRREFLHVSLLGAGGLALAGLYEACGGPTKDVLTATTLQGLLDARTSAGAAANALQVSPAGSDLVVGSVSHLVFFLQRQDGTLVHGAGTRVWLTPTVDPAAKLAPQGPFPAPWWGYAHPDAGPPLPQGLNGLAFTFTQPGLWTLVVETTSGPHLLGKTVVANDGKGIKAQGSNGVPVPGQKAPASDTPTVADPKGVNPVCTRNPPCDMHQITLKDAIANGRPTAFTVATPRFCQSRNCGPSLEELIAVEATLKDKVNFVHVEPYASADDAAHQVTTPVVNQWGMESEPWLIIIDKAGVIQSRFDGGFAAGQIQAALAPLLA